MARPRKPDDNKAPRYCGHPTVCEFIGECSCGADNQRECDDKRRSDDGPPP